MKIYLSRDRANAKLMYERMKDNIDKEVQYLFVPDQYTLLSDINIMKDMEVEVLMDLRVKSISSFSSEVLTRHGGIAKELISEPGKAIILRKVLLENKESLEVLKSEIRTKGFIKELLRTIDEFKDLRLTREEIENLLEEDIKKGTKAKLKDILIILDSYNEILSDNYVDQANRLELLIDKLDSAQEYHGVKMFFDHYNSMTNLELDFIGKLKEIGADLSFFILMDPKLAKAPMPEMIEDSEVFETTYKLFKALKEIGGRNLKVIDLDQETSKFIDVGRKMFSYKSFENKSKNKDIKIYQSSSTEDEVRTLVELILDEIESGKKFSDISVIVSQGEEYFEYIRRSFLEEEIPFFIDKKNKYIDNNFAKYLLTILNLVVNKLSYEDVSNFLDLPFEDLNQEDIEIFKDFCKRRQISGLKFFDDAYFELDTDYLSKQRPDVQEDLINTYQGTTRVREYLLNLISDYYLEMSKSQKVDSYFKILFNFIELGPINRALMQFINSQNHIEVLSSENSQVWEIFISTLNQLATIISDVELKGYEFSTLIKDGLEGLEIGVIPPSQDSVFVGTIDRTRSNPTDSVYILGLNDAYIPSKTLGQSNFTDEEKESLNSFGLGLSIKSKEAYGEELINLFTVIQMAKENLNLSYSISDSKNTSMDMSQYLSNLLRNLPELSIIDTNKIIENPKKSKSLIKEKIIENIRNLRDKNDDLEEDFYFKIFSYLQDFKSHYTKSIEMAYDIDNTRIIDKTTCDSIYNNLSEMSISRLQTYSKCPYKHFVSYDLKPTEKRNYNIDYREVGDLAHESLAKFLDMYNENPEYYRNLEEKHLYDLAGSLIKDYSQMYLDKVRLNDNKNEIILEISKNLLGKNIKNLIRQLSQSSFEKKEGEVSFGREREIPGFKIDLGNRIIELVGVIDRLDTMEVKGENNIMVVDYKTGSMEFDLTLCLEGIDIQLPVYLMVAENKNPKNKGVGFFYLPIKDEIANLRGMDSEDSRLIENEILRALSLDGVVIKDQNIINSIQGNVESGPSIIRFRGRGKDKDNTLTEDNFKKLLNEVSNKIISNLKNILEGDIEAFPYLEIGDNPINSSECSRCSYRDICKFHFRKNQNYRLIQRRQWEEFGDKDE